VNCDGLRLPNAVLGHPQYEPILLVDPLVEVVIKRGFAKVTDLHKRDGLFHRLGPRLSVGNRAQVVDQRLTLESIRFWFHFSLIR
jgi:hypothetical protein